MTDLFSTLLLIMILGAIAAVDLARRVIPDALNAALGCAGAARAVMAGADQLWWALFSAIATGALLVLLRWMYRRLRRVQGLGLGDVKFLVAAAPWTGLQGLPWTVLLASISGLALVIMLRMACRPVALADRIAFGPHLAVGLLATWLFVPLDMS